MRRKGSFFKGLAVTFLLLGIAGSVLIVVVSPQFNAALGGYGMSVPFAVGAALCLWVYARAKRYQTLSAQDVMAADPRPPVVYLRSFKDDRDSSVNTSKNYFPLWRLLHPIKLWASPLNTFDTRTDEEIMADVLRTIGPVIGIGRPGEKLPQLGAARLYVSNEEWQQTVHGFLDQAGLVVLRLGKTPGFFWEVEQSARKIDPTRLLLLVPLSARRYEEFRAKAGPHFPRGLPDYNCSVLRRIFGANLLGDLKAMIYFQPDWTPVMVDLARVKWPWKYKLRMAGRRDMVNAYDWALQPVYRQIGIAWQPPHFSFRRVCVLLYKSVPILFLIFLAGIGIWVSLR